MKKDAFLPCYFAESCTFARVKKIFLQSLFFLLLFLVAGRAAAQYVSAGEKKNALTFNLGQYLVNEINLGYEHFFSANKSSEFSAGLIYRNPFWIRQAENWSNSQYFYERGFALRLTNKIYRKASERNGRRNYMAYGFSYQYLYIPNEWFDVGEVKSDSAHWFKNVEVEGDSSRITGNVSREIFQHRYRNRFGFQLTLGHIFPAGKTFAFELYYGIGVRGIFSSRFDVDVRDTFEGTSKPYTFSATYVSNTASNKFYVRPSIHAGVKLRIGW